MDLNLDAYTFGVEIEFTGCTRKTAAAAVAAVLNSSVEYRGEGYDTYAVADSRGRLWKVMRDSSVIPEKKAGGRIVSATDDYKCEFVTPILRYSDDMDILQRIVRALRSSAKGFANESAGIHVHVGAENHTPATLRNLANIFKSKQDLLYRSLGVKPRRTSYCKKLEDEFVDRLNSNKPKTMDSFANDVYKNHGGTSEMRHHYSSARLLRD